MEEIFGAKNQLIQPRNISHKAENTENIKKNKRSKLTKRTRKIDFRINESDWFVYISNASSITTKITVSVSSAVANTILKGNPFISAKNSSKPPIKNIITIVDNKFISLE